MFLPVTYLNDNLYEDNPERRVHLFSHAHNYNVNVTYKLSCWPGQIRFVVGFLGRAVFVMMFVPFFNVNFEQDADSILSQSLKCKTKSEGLFKVS